MILENDRMKIVVNHFCKCCVSNTNKQTTTTKIIIKFTPIENVNIFFHPHFNFPPLHIHPYPILIRVKNLKCTFCSHYYYIMWSDHYRYFITIYTDLYIIPVICLFVCLFVTKICQNFQLVYYTDREKENTFFLVTLIVIFELNLWMYQVMLISIILSNSIVLKFILIRVNNNNSKWFSKMTIQSV